MNDRLYRVLNFGAGVQSTTLYLMALRGDEPEADPFLDFGEAPEPIGALDAAIFADVGEEPLAVYRHLRNLIGMGGPPIIVANIGSGVVPTEVFLEFVGRFEEDGEKPAYGWLGSAAPGFIRLGDNLLDGVNPTGQRFISIPAYTTDREGVEGGKTRRQCTAEFKAHVVERTIRRALLGLAPRRPVPKGVRIERHFGLSYDEPGRVSRVRARLEAIPWCLPRFPLYDRFLTRADCLDYLRRILPYEVPRSACTFCPFHDNREWARLRHGDPGGYRRAVEVDKAIRGHNAAAGKKLDRRLYVHRSCVPLERADLGRAESEAARHVHGFAQECEGMCGS